MEPPLFFRTAVCFEEEGTSWGCQSSLAFFPHLVFWCLLSNKFDRPPRILFDGESAVFSFLVFSLSVFSDFFFPLWPACELFRAEAWGTISICPCFLSSSQTAWRCFSEVSLSSHFWSSAPYICSQKVAPSEGKLIKNHIQSNCHFVYEKASSGWKWQAQALKINAQNLFWLKVRLRH